MNGIRRNLAIVVCVTAVTASGALAECGIGSKIWAGRSGTLPWLAALTTNIWTFKAVSTTFEIMGCGPSDNWLRKLASAEVRHYASTNFDRLAEDVARGDGETLDGFARLIGVESEARSEFNGFAQERFVDLFPHDEVTVDEFLAALARSMAADDRFVEYL